MVMENAETTPDSSRRRRPPGPVGLYVVAVLAVALIDLIDGGLAAEAVPSVAFMCVLMFGLLWPLRLAWLALVVLHGIVIIAQCRRGEWWFAATNLALLWLLIARPTRHYVFRRQGEASL